MSPGELRPRGGEAARTAIVEIKAVWEDLHGPWRPGGWQEPLRKSPVVEAKEFHPPEGIRQPLQGRLLTSLACETLAQARRVLGR